MASRLGGELGTEPDSQGDEALFDIQDANASSSSCCSRITALAALA